MIIDYTKAKQGARSAKVISVIEVISLKGAGIEADPYREITQYWSFDGKLLAVYDPSKKGEITIGQETVTT